MKEFRFSPHTATKDQTLKIFTFAIDSSIEERIKADAPRAGFAEVKLETKVLKGVADGSTLGWGSIRSSNG